MPVRRMSRWIAIGLSCSVLLGCLAGEKKLDYIGDAPLQYYKDVARQIQYPDVCQETVDTVSFSGEPRRLRHPTKDELWEMTLDEALRIALDNADMIRTSNEFLATRGNLLMSNGEAANSVYDPAIADTGVNLGARGLEAALADFDARFTTNLMWSRSEQVTEAATTGFSSGDERAEENADFRASLEKNFANGGRFELSHNWQYSRLIPNSRTGAIGGRRFDSYYTSSPGRGLNRGLPTIGLEYRQPLWAGAGTEFTRIAGPVNLLSTLQRVSSVNQGVVIARIRNDISLSDFEANVRNLAKDVEDLYWDLSLAYRRYHAESVAKTSSLRSWREVKSRLEGGLEGGSAAEEAQARDAYFETRGRAEEALAVLYSTEGQLRRLLGLPVNDGRIIQPVDEPLTAEFVPEWTTCLVEALTRRVEIRKQKWTIKSLELQLKASKSLTKPRLDFVSRYEINGYGNNLLGTLGGKNQNAYKELFRGEQTGWGLGFEFNMPLGFRAAQSQVEHLELRVAKSRAVLAAQELEISHELRNAFQLIAQHYQMAQTSFNRRRAAERRVQAYDAEYRGGTTALDLLLRAQLSLAQAEISYYQSLIEYNKGIAELRYRKGTLLEDDSIYLAEGLSNPEAYTQALRHALARSHALQVDYGETKPAEFAFDEPVGQVDLALPPANMKVEADEDQVEDGNQLPTPVPPAPEGQPPAAPRVTKPAGPSTDASDNTEKPGKARLQPPPIREPKPVPTKKPSKTETKPVAKLHEHTEVPAAAVTVKSVWRPTKSLP